MFSPDGRLLAYQADTAGADIFYRAVAGDTVSKVIAATRAVEDSGEKIRTKITIPPGPLRVN